MALCKNPVCQQPLGSVHWVDGYCSKRCALTAVEDGEPEALPLLDPTDPTGRREIARNRDEVDALLYLAELDPRLPRLVYLRKLGLKLRAIGAAMRPAMNAMACYRLLRTVTPNLLRSCGLRRKMASGA